MRQVRQFPIKKTDAGVVRMRQLRTCPRKRANVRKFPSKKGFLARKDVGFVRMRQFWTVSYKENICESCAQAPA